jgi:peptidyl-prolyl cis-trans isomerase B (cyclophilin B)
MKNLVLILSILMLLACKSNNEKKTAEKSEAKVENLINNETMEKEQIAENSEYSGDLTQVEIQTTKGNMIVMLYDETPLHRDNFVKLAETGFYNDLLFHRVIKEFMIQCGDPESKAAPAGKMLGSGGPGYTIPAEIKPQLIHKKGALAAARTGDQFNPEKASSGSQFYIVQGQIYDENTLNTITTQMRKILSKEQRDIYTTIGGTPFLDNEYTVFGEVIKGLDVIDKIAAVKTMPGDRPVDDVKIIKMTVIKH